MLTTVLSSTAWPGLRLLSLTATGVLKLLKSVRKATRQAARQAHSSRHRPWPEAISCWPHPEPVRVTSPSFWSCTQASVPRGRSSVKQRAWCLLPQDQRLLSIFSQEALFMSLHCRPSRLRTGLQSLFWCCDNPREGLISAHSSVAHCGGEVMVAGREAAARIPSQDAEDAE